MGNRATGLKEEKRHFVTLVILMLALAMGSRSTVTGNWVPPDSTADAVYGQLGSFTTADAGATADNVRSPRQIATDSSGNLYVADTQNNRVLFYPSGSTTATRVYGQQGSFTTGILNKGGISADSLNHPGGVAIDSTGQLFVADTSNNRVLRYQPGNTTADRVYGQAGSFTTSTLNNGGITANSLFNPSAVALDSFGTLYVADGGNNRVLAYSSGSTTPTTATQVYGQLGSFGTQTNNKGGLSATSLSRPLGLATDANNFLYVADSSNNRVLSFAPGNTVAAQVYGQLGAFITSTSNKGGLTANSLSFPSSVATDSNGNLYVADSDNNRVLMFEPNNTAATFVYGQLGSFTTNAVNVGGTITANGLFNPTGVATDSTGNLYVDDNSNNRILKFVAVNDTTAPVITVNVSPLPNSNGWNHGPVTVSFTVNDPESTVTSSGCGASTLSSETSAAGTTLTCSASSQGGSMSQSVTVKIDLTAPTASSSQTPAANVNGWNNTEVTVNLSCQDALSGVTVLNSAETVTSEGSNQSRSLMCTDLAGNTALASLTGINIDKTAPAVVFGAASPAANANGWNNSDVSFDFSAADSLSGLASTSMPGPLHLSTEGDAVTGSVTVTDKAGNSATFTSPSVKIDKTAPTATASRNPAPNVNGWNNTAVTVSFNGSDSLSGIASCSNPIVKNADGAGQSAQGTCTDLAGNTSTPSTISSINIDKTAPTLTGSRSPAANTNGWNNTDVTVSFTCTDSLSGAVSTPAAAVVSTEGANQSTSAACQDKAGNEAKVTVSGINIDKTAPAVANVAALPNNVSVNEDVSLSALLNDSGSSNSVRSMYLVNNGAPTNLTPWAIPGQINAPIKPFTAVGTYNVCVRSADLAGNVSADQCIRIQVNEDPLDGFVTGGGFIETPAGADKSDRGRRADKGDKSDKSDKLHFAFTAKFLHGSPVPSGNAEFQWKSEEMNFKSTKLIALVGIGERAQIIGTGTINGKGTYGFILTAIDGDLIQKKTDDRFRLQILGPGGVLYDSAGGGPDDATTPLSGGSIVIHKSATMPSVLK